MMTCVALALLATACAEDPPPVLVETPDDKPLSRMTAAQYESTARDLFAPAEIQEVTLPYELSIGAFNNNVEVTTATSTLVEAYHSAALSISQDVMDNLDAVLPCQRGEQSCGQQYLAELAQRAFRRPLSEQERTTLIADFDGWMASYGFDAALQLSIQLLLQSPEYIYFIEDGLAPNDKGDIPLTSYEVATRLSYFLWNTMPDERLFELAAQDKLRDREAIATEAVRMLEDARAHEAVMRFHRQLFDLDKIGNNGVDPDYFPYLTERYPDEDTADLVHILLQPAMRWESELFIDQIVFNGDAKLSTMLTSSRSYATPAYSWLYGVEGSELSGEPISWTLAGKGLYDDEEGEGQQEYYPIDLDPNRRAGVLTHIGWLHSHANPRQPSPVHRGVFVLNRLLCRKLTAPTDVPALETTNAGKEPTTNRDRYAIHTESAACKTCHVAIDGIGFAFEGYDSLGRWRDTDNGYPVDTTGELSGTDQDGPVSGAVELMHKLGKSRAVHDCYTRQWFRYAFGRNEAAADEAFVNSISEGFWNAGGDARELMINLAASYGFRHRRAR